MICTPAKNSKTYDTDTQTTSSIELVHLVRVVDGVSRPLRRVKNSRSKKSPSRFPEKLAVTSSFKNGSLGWSVDDMDVCGGLGGWRPWMEGLSDFAATCNEFPCSFKFYLRATIGIRVQASLLATSIYILLSVSSAHLHHPRRES